MDKEEREKEAERICKALPNRPSEQALAELAKGTQMKQNAAAFKTVWATDGYEYEFDDLKATKSRVIQVTCGECGETYLMPRGVNGYGEPCFECDYSMISNFETFICPECGTKCTAYHTAKMRYGRVRFNQFTFMTAQRVLGYLVFIEWVCERYLFKDGTVEDYFCAYRAATMIDGKPVRFAHGMKNMGGISFFTDWQTRKTYSEGMLAETDFMWGVNAELVNGYPEEKSGLLEFNATAEIKNSLALYIRLWHEHPNVENLVKSGASRFVYEMIMNAMTWTCTGYSEVFTRFCIDDSDNHVDWSKVKPNEMLRMTKEEFSKFKGMGFDEIRFYRTIRDKRNVRLTPEQVEAYKKYNYSQATTVLTQGMRGVKFPPVKLINYLEKNRERDSRTSIGFYSDYLKMLEDYYNEIPESMVYPRSIMDAHEDIRKRIRYRENKETNEGIVAMYEENKGLSFEDEETGLSIRPVKTHQELIDEGEKLGHCVATYADSVAKGKTEIMLIRKLAEPDEPFYTLEWKDGKVNQNRGRHNCARTAEVRAFENKWLDFVRKGDARYGDVS